MDQTDNHTEEAEVSIKSIVLRNTTSHTQQATKWKEGVILSLLLLLLCLIAVFVSKKDKPRLVTLEGQGLSRDYKIQYRVIKGTNYQNDVDSLLNLVEQTLDNYIEVSEVARFNHYTCEPFCYNSPFFYPLLAKSKEVYNNTQGAFDPTVAPLVDLWKKKLKKGTEPNYIDIQSLLEYVSLDYIVVNEKRVKRLKEGVKIDLSSIIPSYGVDIISSFLQSKDIKDFCIELGNEAIAVGVDSNKNPWQIKHTIADGQAIANPFSLAIKLGNKAFSIVRKHTPSEMEENMRIVIDPQTGYPPNGDIIAALVFANDCTTASAYATALIIKNFSAVLEILTKIENIEVFLIYKENDSEIAFYNTPGLKIWYQEDSQEINIEPTLHNK